MKRLNHAVSILTVCVLAFAGCKRATNSDQKNDASAVSNITEVGTIRLAYQPIVFGMTVFVAQDQQFFAKNGLTADAKSFTSANDMINALVAGQVDMVPGAPLVPVLSLESQYPGRFRVFAHSIMTSDKPFDRILVKNTSPIKTVADLVGKKLALIPGTTAMNAMKAYLKRSGVDPSTITFVQLAPTAQLPALQSDAVDALYAYEPILTIALSQDAYRCSRGRAGRTIRCKTSASCGRFTIPCRGYQVESRICTYVSKRPPRVYRGFLAGDGCGPLRISVQPQGLFAPAQLLR